MFFARNITREQAEEEILRTGKPIIRHTSLNMPDIYAITYISDSQIRHSLIEWDLFNTGTVYVVAQFNNNTIRRVGAKYDTIKDAIDCIYPPATTLSALGGM